MDINFYDHNGQRRVLIKDEYLEFDEAIEKVSPNGNCLVATGYWHNNDEDSDDYGDDIDGTEEAIVFKDGAILYRIKGLECLDGDCSILRDDGALYIFEDETISIWSEVGKPAKKKFSCSCDDYGLSDEYIWVSGYGEDGGLRLSVFLVESGKIWTKKLKDDICQIKAVFMKKNETAPEQSYFIATAETYENGDISLKYGIDGKRQELTKVDIQEVKAIEPKPLESASTKPQKKKFPLWLIILAAIIILALIGKST